MHPEDNAVVVRATDEVNVSVMKEIDRVSFGDVGDVRRSEGRLRRGMGLSTVGRVRARGIR
jgi:hypothetical protein